MTSTLNQIQKQSPDLSQIQRLIMLPEMQQAIHVLQMPVMELGSLVETQLSQNPVIELEEPIDDDLERLEEENEEREDGELTEKELIFNEHDFEILQRLDKEFKEQFSDEIPNQRTSDDDKYQTFIEQSICKASSLFEHLMKQAVDTFTNPIDLAIAEHLIGSFDENGFLNTNITEISLMHNYPISNLKNILKEIQSFDPPGVGASSLQESLLIQLRYLGKQDTVAYEILENYYEDLLHNRIPLIQKNLHCGHEEVVSAVQNDIAHLDMRPGTTYSLVPTQVIVPDVTLRQEGDEFIVGVNDDFLPPIRINESYLKLINEAKLASETKRYIQEHINSAKWLLKNIHQRNDTLHRLTQVLVKKNQDFFLNPRGQIIPLTMKVVAEELEVHESTVARVVANKYLECPKGLLLLRSFFTASYTTESGHQISSKTVVESIQDMINKEDKHKPLSDEMISKQLKGLGIPCARRTVAKYRTELSLGTSKQRKKF